MSMETMPVSTLADTVSNCPNPMLPKAVQDHLGALLVSVYAGQDVGSDAHSRFADLLAKLDVSLGQAQDRHDEEFRRHLFNATPGLRRFALSLAHDPIRADDLVQDTMLRAWKNRARFALGTNFDAWSFTIMRNQFYTDRRKHREIQDEDGAHTARLICVPNQAGHLDLQDLQAALAKLKPEMREALILVTVEGLSYEDAAVIMSSQIGTVKSRVSRAREKLVRLLGYSGDEVGNDAVMLSAFGGPATPNT